MSTAGGEGEFSIESMAEQETGDSPEYAMFTITKTPQIQVPGRYCHFLYSPSTHTGWLSSYCKCRLIEFVRKRGKKGESH